MLQSTDLNRSRIPVRRGQVQPGPSVSASGGQIDDLQAQIDNKANASTVGGLETALAAAVARIDALEAAIADHEARIAALEP